MRYPGVIASSVAFILPAPAAFAQNAQPSATVLGWLVFVVIVLIVSVAFRIALSKRKYRSKVLLGDLLRHNGAMIHSVEPDVSVAECVRYMNEQDIGAMLVMEDGRLLGIFTERDAITKVLGAGLEPSYTKVSAVMSYNPTCVKLSTTVEEALAIVSSQQIRHLPVLQDDKVLGMVSSSDLIHCLVKS